MVIRPFDWNIRGGPRFSLLLGQTSGCGLYLFSVCTFSWLWGGHSHALYFIPRYRILVFSHVCIGVASASKWRASSKESRLIDIEVVPINSCYYGSLTTAIKWLAALSVPCNTWIFFTRVRAAYHDSRTVVGLFCILWSCTLLSFGTPFTYIVTVVPTGDGTCLVSTVFRHPLESACLLTLAIFDTAVVIAISIRVVSYSLSQSLKEKLTSLLFGSEMGHTSRLFLRSSQIYYSYVYPVNSNVQPLSHLC